MKLKHVVLKKLITDIQSGFASGKKDELGTLQIRMNNVERDGNWNWTKKRRVPATEQQRSKYRVYPNDVLINTTNSPALVGKCARFIDTGELTVFSNHFIRIKVDDSLLNSSYLQRWINVLWSRRYFEGLCTQWVNQASVRKEDILSIKIPLPPIAEQKRIVAILDKADAVRRKRREAIRLTEELLRSVFLDMFGDPVMNPKGWDVVKLETTFDTKPQIGTTKPASSDGDYRVIRVGEIGNTYIDLERCAKVKASESEISRFQCFPGDFLLARAIGSESHLGKASILQDVSELILFDSHVMRLRFNRLKVLTEFFALWLKTKGGRTLFMKEAGRTAVQFNVNAKQISRIKIPLPPINMQNVFFDFYNQSNNLMETQTKKLQESENLFNSLLQRAFTGNL